MDTITTYDLLLTMFVILATSGLGIVAIMSLMGVKFDEGEKGKRVK